MSATLTSHAVLNAENSVINYQAKSMEFTTGALSGAGVNEVTQTISQMSGIFRDEVALRALNQSTVIYRVQLLVPVPGDTEGGLFLGTTFLEPGLVGDEYFMTKGHFHSIRNRSEYYITISGAGGLVLMDENRTTWVEPMSPGSIHYIPACVAHRVANIGNSVLSFIACWPSDSGHDYASILGCGFSARLRSIHGSPTLVSEQ